MALDGASVRSAWLWIQRSHRHSVGATTPAPYRRAKPGRSDWNTATLRSPRRWAVAAPAAPRAAGEARCTMSGWNDRSVAASRGEGSPTGNERYTGSATAGTRTTRVEP